MKRYLLILLLCFFMLPGFACLILFITDGKTVLVANHEDWYATDAEISFIPAAAGKLGMLYFDFASEGAAQGGMNTAGLFLDGTRTPYAPYAANEKKPDCHCYIWQKILAECRTTEQAISYIEKFKIPEIEQVHILLADRDGQAAIIGVYNGQLQVHRRIKNYQLLTNFNINDPAYGGEEPCQRFATAEAMLKTDSSVTISNLENILSKTHQEELTAYSNIYNLRTGEVVVYNKRNFQKKITIHLAAELRKGKHRVALARLFN